MLSYAYLGYQAERPKSRAEQREADAQLGQLFAALGQLLCVLAKPVRALRRLPQARDIDLQPDTKGRQCSPEQGSAAGEHGACGAQRRPLAVG